MTAHNYDSENRCIRCGAYRDQALGEGLVCKRPPPGAEITLKGMESVYFGQSQHVQLQLLRSSAGMTRTGVALLLGVSIQTVESWEDGSSTIPSDKLLGLLIEVMRLVYKNQAAK